MMSLRRRFWRATTGLAISCAWALAALLAGPAGHSAQAAEIHSNGRGGGDWSQADTWHGGKLPGPEDSAVLSMRDTVTFAGDSSATPTCKSLYMDPESVLVVSPREAGPTVLCVAGPVESYGVIKMDATRHPDAVLELRVGGAAGPERQFVLKENSALLVYGRKGLPENQRNVRIIGLPYDAAGNRTEATITARDNAMIDVHDALFHDAALSAVSIDNTGSKSNERLNIVGCRFTGYSHVGVIYCDTAVVRDNVFEPGAGLSVGYPAILSLGSMLTQMRGNNITGYYSAGIQVQYDVDATATENVIRNCAQGFHWHGANGMVKQNLVSQCSTGMIMYAGSSVLEQVVLEDCASIGFQIYEATAQLTSCQLRNLKPEAKPVTLDNASITLLNCNIAADQITLSKKPPKDEPWVQAMQYLVVRVKGKTPENVRVEPQTSAQSGGVPAGKADLNVRNAPALLDLDHLTPLPATQKALVLRSWQINHGGTLVNAPFYDLRILAPADQGPAKVLHSQLVEPMENWFRPEPDAPLPTLEVNLP